jgi:hypothetical protein
MRFISADKEIAPLFFDQNGKIIGEGRVLRRLFGLFTHCVDRIKWKFCDKVFTLTRNPGSPWRVVDGDRSIGIAVTMDGVPVQNFGVSSAMPSDASLAYETEFEMPYNSHVISCMNEFTEVKVQLTHDIWTLIEQLKKFDSDDISVVTNRCDVGSLTVERTNGCVYLHYTLDGKTFTHAFGVPNFGASVSQRFNDIDSILSIVRSRCGLFP